MFTALKAEFPGAVGSTLRIQGKKDPGQTGNFEIMLAGKLIHAKSQGKVGTCSTQEELNAVFEAVRAIFTQKGFPIPARDEEAVKALAAGGRDDGCIVA